MIPLLADVPTATAPAGGMLERMFNVMKADPVIGFFVIVLMFASTVSWLLVRSYAKTIKQQNDQISALSATLSTISKTHADALAAEVQKRVDLYDKALTTQVALGVKTGMALDAIYPRLGMLDRVLPPLMEFVQTVPGSRRRPGSTGSMPSVPPKVGGTP